MFVGQGCLTNEAVTLIMSYKGWIVRDNAQISRKLGDGQYWEF